MVDGGKKKGWVIFIKIKELEWGKPGFNPVELLRQTIWFLSANSYHNGIISQP